MRDLTARLNAIEHAVSRQAEPVTSCDCTPAERGWSHGPALDARLRVAGTIEEAEATQRCAACGLLPPTVLLLRRYPGVASRTIAIGEIDGDD